MDFDAWVRSVFGRPVTGPWYWADGPEVDLPTGRREAVYLARLFADPLPAVGRYSDSQLNQGFWFLNSAVPPCAVSRLFSGSASWPVRRAAIRAIGDLYEKLFAVRCTPHLSWINEPGGSPLNEACYMWWDSLPAATCARLRTEEPRAAETDAVVLDVLRRTLALDSVACQEAALHGLGHRRQHYPAEVEAIIDDFLGCGSGLRPELVEYARRARVGYVQ